ncbi:tumor necrosis factor receptor superfamily member 4 isoform X1 [Papio anubis]|uniref:tumor necrosis factor receptor superfamily member 4 isoform X1 n=1 Tax=Papio anubis TaxID=9555 RepID=UPI0012AD782C|nr:tumor necrosis factor receptor superfamily member 4 isoform X1 [Papio anubis]
MCVGARRLGRGPCAALLLLGLGLSTTAKLHCVGDTYPSNDRCCQECRPGNGMVSRCNRSQNTVCRPCGPGFYNDVVSAKPCKACTWCNLRSGSERKQPCTATQDTVCRCRAGTQPLDSYKPGVDCAPCPPGHFSPGDNQACKPWTTAPWPGSTPCSQPAIARTPSVRTGTPHPHSPRRPRAPRPGPPLSSPLKPGPEPHRDPPPGPWRSPGALRLLPSWAWAWRWGCWAPWPCCWPCSCSGGTRGCPPMPPKPLGEAVSGPPSKRSRLTRTPPWPRSDPGPPRWTLGPARLEPGGLLGEQGRRRPPAPPRSWATLRRSRCRWLPPALCLRMPCIPPASPGHNKTLADGSLQLALWAAHLRQGGLGRARLWLEKGLGPGWR